MLEKYQNLDFVILLSQIDICMIGFCYQAY